MTALVVLLVLSQLVVPGIGEGEMFLGSNAAAFLRETRSVQFPDDGDFVLQRLERVLDLRQPGGGGVELAEALGEEAGLRHVVLDGPVGNGGGLLQGGHVGFGQSLGRRGGGGGALAGGRLGLAPGFPSRGRGGLGDRFVGGADFGLGDRCRRWYERHRRGRGGDVGPGARLGSGDRFGSEVGALFSEGVAAFDLPGGRSLVERRPDGGDVLDPGLIGLRG
ncbi:MAG: hypothetical protein KY450_14290 [Actinobacteria bacterium]|nr:hypothetical protein [Actinomycetota bacterium]